MTALPAGFHALTGNAGVKDASADFAVVWADGPVPAAAVFTRSIFAGPSVELSRARAANRVAQAVVVVSKNANVATGPAGRADAEELTAAVAAHIGADVEDVLVASTGVIGRPYPMHRLRDFLGRLGELVEVAEAEPVATAMMTTDTVAKVAEARAGAARVVGVAKGVGMIEPDMATMLAFVFTDAEVDGDDLDAVARRVVARTFNSLSVDTDTSTSDTFAVLASGRAGPVHASELEHALHDVCLQLTRKLACDGEGATKLLTVTVTGAADELQARTVAKSRGQLAAGQDGRARRRPELGSRRHGGGEVLAVHGHRPRPRHRALRRDRGLPPPPVRRRPGRGGHGHEGGRGRDRRGPRRGGGRRVVDRVRLRPRRRVRPDQRRLHHLSTPYPGRPPARIQFSPGRGPR